MTRKPSERPLASVVIPAHNESGTIARGLEALHRGLGGEALDVVVVCNGCSDDTARVARAAAARVRVLETPIPSKAAAVELGNQAAQVFPRVHLDADVELDGLSLRALVEPVTRGQVLATAPRRLVPRDDCGLLVRWYYDVWETLPRVRAGLFGRGVVILSAEGQRRVSALPRLMGDDLGMSEVFATGERRIVENAVVVVRPPRTLRDLLRRRVRVVTGNAQADAQGVRRPGEVAVGRSLLQLVREDPARAPKVAVFLAVTLTARILASRAIRAGDFTTWQRDESSRR